LRALSTILSGFLNKKKGVRNWFSASGEYVPIDRLEVKGYDLVTAWGSPNGSTLIKTLAP
jgi:hypothetical protein